MHNDAAPPKPPELALDPTPYSVAPITTRHRSPRRRSGSKGKARNRSGGIPMRRSEECMRSLKATSALQTGEHENPSHLLP